MEIQATTQRKYPARFLLAFSGAFLLVLSACIAVGGRGQDLFGLTAGSIVILVISLPAAGISAYFLRRDLAVVLLAQSLTIVFMAAFQFWA
jgi:hypothetical protein